MHEYLTMCIIDSICRVKTWLISPPLYSIIFLMSGAPLGRINYALYSSSFQPCHTFAKLAIRITYWMIYRNSEPHYQSWSVLVLIVTRSQGKCILILRAQVCFSCFPVSYMTLSMQHWYCS